MINILTLFRTKLILSFFSSMCHLLSMLKKLKIGLTSFCKFCIFFFQFNAKKIGLKLRAEINENKINVSRQSEKIQQWQS